MNPMMDKLTNRSKDSWNYRYVNLQLDKSTAIDQSKDRIIDIQIDKLKPMIE